MHDLAAILMDAGLEPEDAWDEADDLRSLTADADR